MRIQINDKFDNDIEEQYKAVDEELNIGNGILANKNVEIVDVEIVDVSEEINKENIVDNNIHDFPIKDETFINNKDEIKNKSSYKSKGEIKGKITVISKLGSSDGALISSAKINLYALNGLSPKLISSKFTNNDGVVIYDNLSDGSYRVIAIVDRKYFEKPTYLQWNEVTINEDLKEEKIIVINKIKSNVIRS